MNSELKAFAVGEHDVYAAKDAEQALALYVEQTGDDEVVSADDVYELDNASLDHRYPDFDEDERPIKDKTISIREMLAQHGEEPGWLCGSWD